MDTIPAFTSLCCKEVRRPADIHCPQRDPTLSTARPLSVRGGGGQPLGPAVTSLVTEGTQRGIFSLAPSPKPPIETEVAIPARDVSYEAREHAQGDVRVSE
ncbi:hypothetical protein BaRGS_00024278 [Batillaria attramentaria]|uniref:Uncharacterized protein n=1 Tax=Batillaria attramentaria TaxID=370345 RepID=A0ABD0KC37_9CAEN